VTSLDDILADGALTRVLRSFKEATGIAARVVDPTGAPAIASRTWEDCAFCRLVRSSEEGPNRCSKSYAYAARQAASLGDLYVFQCHAGLVCWAAPLVSEGTLLGAVLCGQVIMWEPDEYLVRDSIERLGDLDIPLTQLEAAIGELEQVTTVRVQAAAELLFAVASYIVRSEDLALNREMRYTGNSGCSARPSRNASALKSSSPSAASTRPSKKESFYRQSAAGSEPRQSGCSTISWPISSSASPTARTSSKPASLNSPSSFPAPQWRQAPTLNAYSASTTSPSGSVVLRHFRRGMLLDSAGDGRVHRCRPRYSRLPSGQVQEAILFMREATSLPNWPWQT
jgi:ligand-binding sensor protein